MDKSMVACGFSNAVQWWFVAILYDAREELRVYCVE